MELDQRINHSVLGMGTVVDYSEGIDIVNGRVKTYYEIQFDNEIEGVTKTFTDESIEPYLVK